MLHPPDQKEVQRNIRAQVCASCPFRTPGTDANSVDEPRPCERACPLFTQLPDLAEASRQLDPIVGHPTRTLARLILKIGRGGKRSATVVACNGRKVLRLLDNLFQT